MIAHHLLHMQKSPFALKTQIKPKQEKLNAKPHEEQHKNFNQHKCMHMQVLL